MAMSAVASLLIPGVYATAIFLFTAPCRSNVLKPRRMGCDDSYCWRNSLEEDGIQTLQGDEYSVSPVCRCQQLLSAERNRIRIAPRVVVPVDTVFNFLRNWLATTKIGFFTLVSPISELRIESAYNTMHALH
jgi:hypothetical protein